MTGVQTCALPIWLYISVVISVPICFFVALVTLLPEAFISHSQFHVAKIFQELDKENKAYLVYTSRMPNSADFYTNGRAIGFQDRYVENAMKKLHDNEEDFYVIKRYDKYQFPEKFFKLTKEVGRFRERIIYREVNHAVEESVNDVTTIAKNNYDKFFAKIKRAYRYIMTRKHLLKKSKFSYSSG